VGDWNLNQSTPVVAQEILRKKDPVTTRPDVSPAQTALTALPVLTTSTGVVFPEMVVTFRLESEEARAALQSSGSADRQLLLVPQVDGRSALVGTVVRIEHTQESSDGTPSVVIRGVRRAKVGAAVSGDGPGLWVDVEPVEPVPDTAATGLLTAEIRALADEYRALAGRLLELVGAPGMASSLNEVAEPGALADTIGWWPDLEFESRVELLETVDVHDRLKLAVGWVRELLAKAELMGKIRAGVSDDLEKGQREAILRLQMEAIQAELGDDTESGSEYGAKLAELDAPADVIAAITKEVERLDATGGQGQEASYIRTWLDHVFEIPWGVTTSDSLDLEAAVERLDADHTGLKDVKDRIVEFLAVRKLHTERAATPAGEMGAKRERSGNILVLVGPPGVGKTSLGESVARTLGREFVRMSLGGISDEAEVRGHRRTYVGARPGRIVRAIADAGTMNPVILLDEIDKIASHRGDPSSALLEVLDPAQNSTFRDNYLEMDLDLSDVFFIATANVAEQIPGPLLDRMEVIRITGYSADEKAEIARDHLLPRVLRRNSLTDADLTLGEGVIESVIADHTREAGVRRLEQRLDRLIRRVARHVAEGEQGPIEVTVDELTDVLGHTPPIDRPANRITAPGIATGLAVSGAGGDVLFVEATVTEGKPGLSLTGQLGEVMQESGEIALTYLRSHADELGISFGDSDRFHVHFPAGATPKDGPSAGVTMTTAIASALTGRQVRSDVAMTGEITLHGKVLPIGGVKEKVLAAQRAGVTTVILPAGNRHDADDLPDEVVDAMELRFVDDVAEVLRIALTV
jgi:ATP-dependent Lon protease